jgi:hypothetical protein
LCTSYYRDKKFVGVFVRFRAFQLIWDKHYVPNLVELAEEDILTTYVLLAQVA